MPGNYRMNGKSFKLSFTKIQGKKPSHMKRFFIFIFTGFHSIVIISINLIFLSPIFIFN